MSDESWVHAFSTQLDELRDFPEQAKINNVAHIAKTQERLAGPFVDCVINRLINISTPPTYRKPLFYAIDAIMKAAAPAYVPHFARQLAEKFPMTIRDISDVDRKKLTFMVGTWEERKFFVPELIAKMKNRLQVSATAAPAAAPRAPVFNAPYMSAPVQPGIHNPVVVKPLEQVLLATALAGNAAGGINDLLRLEMNNILQQMYIGMNVSNPLSLDEIAIANPTLYAQLRSQAESNFQALIGNNVLQPVPASASQQTNPNHSNYNSHSNNMNGNRKRPGEFQNDRPSSSYNGNNNNNNNNNNRPSGRNSRYPQPAAASKVPSSGSGGLPPAPPTLTIPPVSSSSSAATSAASYKAPQGANAAAHAALPKDCVSGYVSEAAVIIDVDRVKLITENLTHYKNNPSSIPFSDSDKLAQLNGSLLQRLEGYLASIRVPPKLPAILNGPLPNEPIFAKLNLAAAKGPDRGVVAGPVKRAMPVFNMDLSRSPDVMIRALYEDRPHQYHEDGLRFRTLVQLSQHTDKSLEKKKLMSKMGKQREHRELYCTIEQWVSDFNALNLKNKPTEESKQGNTAPGEAVEEFIIPADENFVRCPFSHESFDKFFDNVEGCFMYRNAVKVFVSNNSNSAIYQKGKPAMDPDTDDEIEGLRYLVVHKPLIVDQWIQEGKATTLEEAIQRFESLGDGALAEKLKQAAGEEDLEDIFFVV